ncbi:MAG: hypothetical protein H6934_14385 [Burkholderiaceae bacterium]|nr:hypothetical protein [Burkholderiaceae bacterium]
MKTTVRVSRPLALAAASLALALPLISATAAEKRCLVVHVPQDDPKSMVQALNIVSNVPRELGVDNVDVELVAQGPGLKLLTASSTQAKRVESLAMSGVTFSACGNTMAAIKRKTGNEPVLLKGVGRVKAGIIRVMELQEKGCSYARP